MPYCSLEEAWGSDFKDASYFQKVNAAPASSSVQNTVPPNLAKNGLENSELQTDSELDKYFPSYNGGPPPVKHMQSAKSKIVPYQVSFPDSSRRNYRFPVEDKFNEDSSDNDSAMDLLEDNEHDIRYLDKQRRVKPEYEPDYMTSEDYFLYKKYLKLADKYKERLRKKFKNFMEDEGNKNILEGFSNANAKNVPNLSYTSYSIRDLIVIIVVGIFLIFALDIFVKMGAKMK